MQSEHQREQDEDAVTVVRRRVRSLDGEPYFINDSYFLAGRHLRDHVPDRHRPRSQPSTG